MKGGCQSSEGVHVGVDLDSTIDSAIMPFRSMMCPRKFSSVRENSHFSGLRVAPFDSIRLRTALSWLSCSSWSFPNLYTILKT